MKAADVIEIKLPADWAAPTPYNFNDDTASLQLPMGTLLADALKAGKDANKSHLSGVDHRH